MQTVKTAISLQRPLFEQAEILAQRLEISRSRLFVIALEEFIRRQENRELLARINAAYADEPDAEELAAQRHMRSTHRRLVEGEW